MLKKITRMTAVAAVLTATAIAAPSAGAQSVLPAGIDAGLGPSSGPPASAAPRRHQPLVRPGGGRRG